MSEFVSGRLLTSSYLRSALPSHPRYEMPSAVQARELECWADRCESQLGPASSTRAIVDVAIVPLARWLGYEVVARQDTGDGVLLRTAAGGRSGPPIAVGTWAEPLARLWRAAVHAGIGSDVRWVFCTNGVALRCIDARHTWSRRHVEFDLAGTAADSTSRALLWTLLRADALVMTLPLLDEAAIASAKHGIEVCRALGSGVLDALPTLIDALRGRTHAPASVVFEHSLTVLYRVLFLLFAEARGLVPLWHPVYRDRYSLDTIVTALLQQRPVRGLWDTVLAISRLAHAGCAAGDFRVPAFNGRLFAPTEAATFDRTRLADPVMRRVIVSVSTTPGAGGERARIYFRDLDVEQLGAVYERVLDYEPSAGATLARTGDVRKATGAFYTPRGLTAYLVEQTLAPLVEGRTADAILALRVLDPAMGSGAFLVAACRYLARVVEDARIREGSWHPGDVTAADRAQLRRDIASRCLYGVDVNPMAVQLGRLSLWLATLAADKPLSFLDHHLVAGNSLIGATPADLLRQPGGGRARERAGPLPLFALADLESSLRDVAGARIRLGLEPDDSAAIVRAKERALAALHSGRSLPGRWVRALDLWCAGWFWPETDALNRALFRELILHVLSGRSSLPPRTADTLLATSDAVAAQQRFLHWPLAFPEVFGDPPRGFDAILGNPPWDMVRGDSGEAARRHGRRVDAHRLAGFVRDAGVYRVESRAHVNRYQLFVERAVQLTRAGGRIGLVLPAGLAFDAGAAPLRRWLFDRTAIDAITGLDNRAGIFPIHRSVRFVLLTATTDRPTTSIRCRFGLTAVEQLHDHTPASPPMLTLPRALIARVSGADDLGIPELRRETDLRIVEKITAAVPRLGDREGWHVTFGRELNASDDRASFTAATGDPSARPVLEGKQIESFRALVDAATLEVRAGVDVRDRAPRRARLAYRDIASATNRLTLIAAIVPARCVTTHTLFCLKSPLPLRYQQVLCALVNSFVANYWIRLRVSTHVTASLMSRLPVPLVPPTDPLFDHLADSSEILSVAPDVERAPEYAELQALVGHLYRLTDAEFGHVLSTFPLIAGDVRTATRECFRATFTDYDTPRL